MLLRFLRFNTLYVTLIPIRSAFVALDLRLAPFAVSALLFLNLFEGAVNAQPVAALATLRLSVRFFKTVRVFGRRALGVPLLLSSLS